MISLGSKDASHAQLLREEAGAHRAIFCLASHGRICSGHPRLRRMGRRRGWPGDSWLRGIEAYTSAPYRAGTSQFDLDIDAGGKIELHQRVDGLRCGVDDVEHALMSSDLELFARLLVDVRRAQHGEFLDLGR